MDFSGQVNGTDVAIVKAAQGWNTVTTDPAVAIRGVDFVYNTFISAGVDGTDVANVKRWTNLGATVTQWAGRHPYLWPFAVDSIWNTPLGASATRQAANLTAPTTTFYDDDVIIMEPDYPITPIYEESAADPWFDPAYTDNIPDRCPHTSNDLTQWTGSPGVPLAPRAVVPNNAYVQSPTTSPSGTMTGRTATTMTDSSKSWTTNQWVGYALTTDSGSFALKITSNTATVLTFTGGWVSGGTPASNGPYDIVLDSVTPNHSTAILLKDRRHVYQTQPLTHCFDGTYTSKYNFGADPNIPVTDLWGQGIFGAHGGSDLSAIGGTIRLHELVPGGKIPHALKIVVTADQLYYNTGNLGLYARSGHAGCRWPARVADSGASADYAGTNPNLTMGSLLALPTNFNVAGLLTEPAQIIATALMKYGAYVCDTGGDSGFRGYYFPTERAGQEPHTPLGLRLPTLIPGPRVVDNFRYYWPTLGPWTASSGDWFDDNATICAALQIITDSGPGTQTGTITSVTANSMYDATNDWWSSFNLTGAVITVGTHQATVTSNSTADGTLFFTGGWTNGTPAAGDSYSIAFSGTIGGAGTRLAPLAPSIGTGPE